jgi:hypothetical protein
MSNLANMILHLLAVFFVCVLVSMIVFSILSTISGRMISARNEWMRGLAAKLGGLKTEGGAPSYPKIKWLRRMVTPIVIHDFFEGRELFIRVVGSRSLSLQIEIRLNRLAKFSIKMQLRDFAAKFQFFRKRIETGDAAFDEKFRLSGNVPKLTRRLMAPELRAKIVDLWQTQRMTGVLLVGNSQIRYYEFGMRDGSDSGRVEAITRLLSAIAAPTEVELEAVGAPPREKKTPDAPIA